MKTTTNSVIPGIIAAEMEADWRGSLKRTPYRSIATTDGGTIWSSPSVTSTSTTPITAAVGSGWSSSTFTSTTPWFGFKPTKPARLTKAQKAMVMDAIAEQLVNPPDPYFRFIPYTGGTLTIGGSSTPIGTVTGWDFAKDEVSVTYTATYDKT